MSNVTRFAQDMDGSMVPEEDGQWVRYSQVEDKLRKLRMFALSLIDHLDYCGWGDAWEHECSEDLRKEARDFEESTK